MRRHWLAMAASAAWLISAGAALAENRLALVIGNSTYRSATPLPNPVNDAKAIADILGAARFEVTLASDLSQTEMRRAIRDFSIKVSEKGADAVVLVFYAGHGLQIDGENFLVPVDARIQRESDVAFEALRLADLMKALESVPSRMRIVILDACRNNPFAELKAGGKGLAIVDAPTGSIVAYATAPGSEAEDGSGRNSPYTAAFLRIVKQPGLAIEQTFKRVRLLVHDATDGRQTPWESSSLTSDFTFFTTGGAVADKPSIGPAGPQVRPRSVSWRDELRVRPPRDAYEIVLMEDTIEAYEEFILLYPADPLAERIRHLLARRAEAAAWRYAVLVNTPAAYAAYLGKYPTGDYATEALRLRERPRVRPIDPIVAPRVIVPPPPLRVSLPPPPPRLPVASPPIAAPAKPVATPSPQLPKPPVASVTPQQPPAGPGGAKDKQIGRKKGKPVAIQTPPTAPEAKPSQIRPAGPAIKRPIAQPQVRRPVAQVRPQPARLRPGCVMQAGKLVCKPPPRR